MILKTRLKQVVEDYREACNYVPELIKQSGLKHTFIQENLGMVRSTFSDRMKKCNWKPEELEKLYYLFAGEEFPISFQKKE